MFKGQQSSRLQINASVFQGSCVGPPMFIINSSDLKPLHQDNYLDKYADDSYLIVGSNNETTVGAELEHIETWSTDNNLKLNVSKTKEIVFYNGWQNKGIASEASLIPGIDRVDSMKILGVTIEDNFSVSKHVSNVVTACMQSFFPIKILKHQGLSITCASTVFDALVTSRLTYASPAWRGFLKEVDKQRISSVFSKAAKWGYRLPGEPSLESLLDKRDSNLFKKILSDPSHVLHHLLPPERANYYNLRYRPHSRILPENTNLLSKNFVHRMLFQNMY